MITGAVMGNLDPIVQLLVRDVQGTEKPVDFVVDTGFNGYLALPQRRIDDLGLLVSGSDNVLLADGSIAASLLYDAVVLWDGQERTVNVIELAGDPLIGTSLLFDHDVTIWFINGGQVIIARTP
ncbi:MAG TPA: hypothetical protein VFB21_17010 [Chthonomonadaceae bacterium]|nr:hypothetical protein [Chthonomonadaceae bacterium]